MSSLHFQIWWKGVAIADIAFLQVFGKPGTSRECTGICMYHECDARLTISHIRTTLAFKVKL